MARDPTDSSSNAASFVTYVASVLTAVMVLFPPFTGVNGTERAFLLTGPGWSRALGAMGEELGLTARLDWVALLVQLGALWAIVLGARRFLARRPTGTHRSLLLPIWLLVPTASLGQDARFTTTDAHFTTTGEDPMNRPAHVFGVVLASCLAALPLSPDAAVAQEAAPTSQEADASRFGIGFQSSWPAYGVSGLYDANEKITVQAVLGALGTVTTVSGRLLYHVKRQEKYSWFGFGTLGLWRYAYDIGPASESESTVGVGGGAGVELDWAKILSPDDDSFPPLFSTIDLGLTLASFDAYDWSALSWGVGLHYRF